MKTFKLIVFYYHLLSLSILIVFLFMLLQSSIIAFVGQSMALLVLTPLPIGLILSSHSLYTKKHMTTNWEKFLTYIPFIILGLIVLMGITLNSVF